MRAYYLVGVFTDELRPKYAFHTINVSVYWTPTYSRAHKQKVNMTTLKLADDCAKQLAGQYVSWIQERTKFTQTNKKPENQIDSQFTMANCMLSKVLR